MRPTSRVLAAALALAAAAVAAPAAAQLRLEPVVRAEGPTVGFVEDPVAPGTFLLIAQDGVVRVVADGAVRETPFLDLRGAISTGGERGLLGLAFPPDAAASGRVFVNFTNPAGDTVVARFTRRADDPHAVDPSSRRDLVWSDGRAVIDQPFANHNGGHLAFGPDGYLYVGMGDGGSGNDPGNRAQSLTTLLGKMLRLDVAVPDDDPRGFAVPPDNPLAGRGDARPEIWALGYRNPWRFAFDDVGEGATGALVVGDVGQNQREEIDYEPAGAGGRNYGWRLREGTVATPGIAVTVPAIEPLVEPIFDYGRGRGQSVTGGYVYRGARLPPSFAGRYFFGDFGSGRIWSLGLAIDPETREARVVDEIEHTGEFGGSLAGVASFARDLAGELYVVLHGGEVFRLAGPEREAPDVTADGPGGRRPLY
jgi:glucose/arabinose dehydrogenase